MLYDDIAQDALPILEGIPEGGMLFYLEFNSLFKGRRHMTTFFCTFNGGVKSVSEFFQDIHQNIAFRLVGMQSWDVFQFGYTFVKLWPLPWVIMPIPTFVPGFWPEPGCDLKEQAYVSFHTEQTGYKRYGRKFIFGMPASWINGDRLNAEGMSRIYGMSATWTTIFHPDYLDFPYTMGKMNRYIGGVKRSPLLLINYWPFIEQRLKPNLVQHRHVNGRKPY